MAVLYRIHLKIIHPVINESKSPLINNIRYAQLKHTQKLTNIEYFGLNIYST